MLNDVVIVLSTLDKNDDGDAYPITQVIRLDYEGTIEDLIKTVDSDTNTVHIERLGAKS